jgi:hypothetical protein
VITDLGEQYEICFHYTYINDKHPEFIGLNAINVYLANDDDEMEVGIVRIDGLVK